MTTWIKPYNRATPIDVVSDGSTLLCLVPEEEGLWTVQQRRKRTDTRTPSGYSWAVARSFTGNGVEAREHIERLLSLPAWSYHATLLEQDAKAWGAYTAAMCRLPVAQAREA